ncbi:hypothetical protein MishRS11D_16170 [Methylomagnum ishizawai]|nr:hypothetical protein MishRS11D_16170 [Methylomagnum ishizawai]
MISKNPLGRLKSAQGRQAAQEGGRGAIASVPVDHRQVSPVASAVWGYREWRAWPVLRRAAPSRPSPSKTAPPVAGSGTEAAGA